MTWAFYFSGSDIMTVFYDVPGPDIAGTTQDNTYYFVTDNAYGGSSQSDN
jgi:hypothetical protein